jgi:hypothetical protein
LNWPSYQKRLFKEEKKEKALNLLSEISGSSIEEVDFLVRPNERSE